MIEILINLKNQWKKSLKSRKQGKSFGKQKMAEEIARIIKMEAKIVNFKKVSGKMVSISKESIKTFKIKIIKTIRKKYES